jgi:hypothetical protein
MSGYLLAEHRPRFSVEIASQHMASGRRKIGNKRMMETKIKGFEE